MLYIFYHHKNFGSFVTLRAGASDAANGGSILMDSASTKMVTKSAQISGSLKIETAKANSLSGSIKFASNELNVLSGSAEPQLH